MSQIRNDSFDRPNFGRRALVKASLAAPFAGFFSRSSFATERSNERVNFDSLTTLETLRAYVRLMGSLKPMTTYTWFSGELWAIRPNETPLPLVSFQSLAKSIWRTAGEDTYIKDSFDCGFFGDLETGKKISRFVNPINGETVEPYHFLYGGGTTTYSEKGIESAGSIKPLNPKWVQSGGQIWIDEIGHGSVENSMDSDKWSREYAGKNLHYGSTTSYITEASELFNTESSYAPYSMSWTGLAPWEPWLLVGDAPGFVQWRATGRKLSSHTEAPDEILSHIQEVQPNYLNQGRPWKGYKSTFKSFMAERQPAA